MTDVAGFTEMMRNNEPQVLSLLRNDIDRIREVIHCNGGEVVKVAGDGILALFSSAPRAVRACIDAQESLSDSPLRHRMAVHAGEVTLTDGDAYGDAINICSRLETITTPGTVTASRIVFDLIKAQGLPDPVRKGKVQLKGIDIPVEVYSWGVGGKFPQRGRKAFGAGLVVAVVALLGIFLAITLSTHQDSALVAANNGTQHILKVAQSGEEPSFDEMMDQAFDDVWREIDEYEAAKADAVKRMDPDSVIQWLENNPLGKRERGQLELEHWGLVKKAIDKGKHLAGQHANVQEIWKALQKHAEPGEELELKAFQQEFVKAH